MKIFGKRKQPDSIDDRTRIEKTFEEKGQEIGKRAGELAQKGVNKFNEVKDRLDTEGKLDKVYDLSDKASEKSKSIIEKVTNKSKEVYDKTLNKNKDE